MRRQNGTVSPFREAAGLSLSRLFMRDANSTRGTLQFSWDQELNLETPFGNLRDWGFEDRGRFPSLIREPKGPGKVEESRLVNMIGLIPLIPIE